MARHDELLEQGTREALESESVDDLTRRIARPIGATVSLAAIAWFLLNALDVVRFLHPVWWLSAGVFALSIAAFFWGAPAAIREWFDSQP